MCIRDRLTGISGVSIGGAFANALGMPIPFLNKLGKGLIPIALAQDGSDDYGKDGLTLLNDRPLNMEPRPICWMIRSRQQTAFLYAIMVFHPKMSRPKTGH